MLIIEGSDHLGKSTLAKAIANKVSEMTGHPPPEIKALSREDGDRTPSEYMALIQPWTIYDRFHISERAYSTAIEGRQSRLTQKQTVLISHAIAAMGGFCIMLTAGGDYDRVSEEGDFQEHNQMFDRETCSKVDGIYEQYGEGFCGPLEVHKIKVTIGRTRRGVDWPATRERVVEMLAAKYMDAQASLGHGMPPNRDEMRAQRGLPDWATGGQMALMQARNQLVSGVIEEFASIAEIDPEKFRLVESGSEVPNGGGYKRQWSFEYRDNGDSDDIQETRKDA